MKHIKPAVLPFFLLLAGLILTELLIMNRDLRTRTACAVAGRGMLSLVQQTMEEPPRVALTFDDGPNSKYTPMLSGRGKHRRKRRDPSGNAKRRTSDWKPYLGSRAAG